MISSFLIIFSIFLNPFQQPVQDRLTAFSLKSLGGEEVSLSVIENYEATAFFFLSPECPLCENYSRTINLLRKDFPENKVAFMGVFPGEFYSKLEIYKYMQKFKPEVTPLLDPDYRLSHYFEARVTPEVFLVGKDGKVLYSGKIDNWIASLGKHRTIITRHYLKDALDAVMNHQPVQNPQTEAVGCLIE